MKFTERLKLLRTQAKLTQSQIAKKLGVSQQAYGDWERGVKKPTQDNLVKLSNIFNVSVDSLLVGEENDVDLSEVEILFRNTSKGMTKEEKLIFKNELMEFMKERKKILKSDCDWGFCMELIYFRIEKVGSELINKK